MEINEPKQNIRTRQNRRRKPLKQKTAARKAYEERLPSISLRVDSDVKTQFQIDAKRNGMTLKQYLTHLVRGANLSIENEIIKAYDKGKAEGDQLGFERGQKNALIKGREKIVSQTRQQIEWEDSLFFDCAKCRMPVRIVRNSEYHYRAAIYLTSLGFQCPACSLKQRLAKLDEPEVGPPPSWWPAYYQWPPKEPSKIPP